MSILINNFEILNNGTQLAIDVETDLTYNISSILVWSMDSFKDYTLAIDLTPILEQVNNKEVLIINAADYNVEIFEDIVFMEVESTFVDIDECAECQSPALGITYNLSRYYNCLMEYLLKFNSDECLTCNDSPSTKMVTTINMLIDTVLKSLEVGYYVQAITMIAKLKKLCGLNNCKNCPTIECASCNSFIQTV